MINIEDFGDIYRIRYSYDYLHRLFIIDIQLEINKRCIYVPCLLYNIKTEVVK
jgi:hypothetical protein